VEVFVTEGDLLLQNAEFDGQILYFGLILLLLGKPFLLLVHVALQHTFSPRQQLLHILLRAYVLQLYGLLVVLAAEDADRFVALLVGAEFVEGREMAAHFEPLLADGVDS